MYTPTPRHVIMSEYPILCMVIDKVVMIRRKMRALRRKGKGLMSPRGNVSQARGPSEKPGGPRGGEPRSPPPVDNPFDYTHTGDSNIDVQSSVFSNPYRSHKGRRGRRSSSVRGMQLNTSIGSPGPAPIVRTGCWCLESENQSPQLCLECSNDMATRNRFEGTENSILYGSMNAGRAEVVGEDPGPNWLSFMHREVARRSSAALPNLFNFSEEYSSSSSDDQSEESDTDTLVNHRTDHPSDIPISRSPQQSQPETGFSQPLDSWLSGDLDTQDFAPFAEEICLPGTSLASDESTEHSKFSNGHQCTAISRRGAITALSLEAPNKQGKNETFQLVVPEKAPLSVEADPKAAGKGAECRVVGGVAVYHRHIGKRPRNSNCVCPQPEVNPHGPEMIEWQQRFWSRDHASRVIKNVEAGRTTGRSRLVEKICA